MNKDRSTGYYNDQEVQSASERQRHVWENLQTLLHHACSYSPAFRQRLEKAGLNAEDIKGLGDWDKIPVLPKKDLVHLQTQDSRLGGLLACDLGELRHIFMSPGPIVDPEARKKDFWGFAEAFYAAGFRSKDIVQMTFSYHFTPAGLMMEEPLHEIGCAVFPAGPGNTEGQIDVMTRLGVNGFVGMASFLKIIADKAEKNGLDLKKDFKLRVAFVAAEKLSETLRSELEERFGMLVRQGYGTADLGCIAYECPEKSGMHLSSRCHVEVCDPETRKPLSPGQPGEVVVTPFNPDYPLIRLATGDLSVITEDPCPCGRKSPRLQGIMGRVDDTVKVKGQFVYPAQVAQALSVFPDIKTWKIVTTNPGGKDKISLYLCCSRDTDTLKVSKTFQEKIKLRAEVHVLEDGHEMFEKGSGIEDKRSWE